MSAQMPGLARKLSTALVATGCFLATLAAVYVLHARWFRVDVVFYSALSDVAIAATIGATGLFSLRSASALGLFEKAQLLCLWLLTGYALAISLPTVIDRSLSFYLLEKLEQRGGGIRLDAMQRVIDDEFMAEYRVLDARLTEQIESGTILIAHGCVRLTEHGQRIAAFSRFFRSNLLPRERKLMGEYSATLTRPFDRSAATVDYQCQ
jgi:hypothetical protein